MPVIKHKIKKKISFRALKPSSKPFMLFPIAIVGSNTNIKIPTKSSITKTPKTRSVNFCFFILRSLKVFMMIVVEDIEIIEPKKKLSIVDQPSSNPVL